MPRPVALYFVAYLAVFIFRAINGSTAPDFLLGLLVSIALTFQISRSILLRIKRKDEAGRYTAQVMRGITLYPVVMMVALPISLVVIVGYLLVYRLTM